MSFSKYQNVSLFYSITIIWNCGVTKTSFAVFGHGVTQSWLLIVLKLDALSFKVEQKGFSVSISSQASSVSSD